MIPSLTLLALISFAATRVKILVYIGPRYIPMLSITTLTIIRGEFLITTSNCSHDLLFGF